MPSYTSCTSKYAIVWPALISVVLTNLPAISNSSIFNLLETKSPTCIAIKSEVGFGNTLIVLLFKLKSFDAKV